MVATPGPGAAGPRTLAVVQEDLPWAVDAAQVLRVVSRALWDGETPRSLSELLGLSPATSGDLAVAPRVMALRAAEAVVALALHGDVTVWEAAPADVLPLPAELCTDAVIFSALCLRGSAPPALLLDPERAARRAAREHPRSGL
ncbi:MAG: hypothetical protein AB2A00_19670 [Myxococcota bacterium]